MFLKSSSPLWCFSAFAARNFYTLTERNNSIFFTSHGALFFKVNDHTVAGFKIEVEDFTDTPPAKSPHSNMDEKLPTASEDLQDEDDNTKPPLAEDKRTLL